MNLKEWLEDYELSKLADDKSIDNKSKIIFILEIEYNHLEITQNNIIKSNEEMLKYLPDDEISKESREININFFNKNIKRMIEIKEKISLLTNNRPFYDFSLKIMKNFKNDYKKYDMTVLKYLSKLDNKDKQMEYKDKCEAIFEIKNIYSDLAENYLNEFSDNESEEDYEI